MGAYNALRKAQTPITYKGFIRISASINTSRMYPCLFKHRSPNYEWQCINIQGMKQTRGGHWNLGILREDSGGTNKPILGAKPPIFPYIFPRIPPQDSQVSCPPLACFIPWCIPAQGPSTLRYLSLGLPPGLSRPFMGFIKKLVWRITKQAPLLSILSGTSAALGP